MKSNTPGKTSLFFSLVCLLFCIACTDYTPKPRGYFRIEPPVSEYLAFSLEELPYTFQISNIAEIELPPNDQPVEWINVFYPSLNAKIYCSYLPITPNTLEEVMDESRNLVIRQAMNTKTIQEQAYNNPELKIYASLFLLDGESASPIQFVITDSSSHFFRGALYYDCIPNADSLAPVNQYIREDIIELIQSFAWK